MDRTLFGFQEGKPLASRVLGSEFGVRSSLTLPTAKGMQIGQIIVWIVVGGFAGTLAGRTVTLKKEGFGRWTNLLVGMIGAAIGGELFKLLRIDFGLGELKVTFEDLIAAFLGSLLVVVIWRIAARRMAKDTKKR
jgi:uncharacterized membrane protein YeaQ/YmgE (transglycosylase-associated protein family)